MAQQKSREPVTAEQLEDLLKSRERTDPVPILKHKAENRVTSELKDVALRGCDASVRALAQCAEGKLLSVVWHCRKHSKAVDACMESFANDTALRDELRRRHGARFPQAVKGYREASNLETKGNATL